MITINPKYFLACAISLFSSMAWAQDDITKEIVVDKDYVPVEQKAVKLKDKPSMVKISPSSKELAYSLNVNPVETGNTIFTLAPFGYNTSLNSPQSRGYLHYGIGSYINMTGSAGYNILNSNLTSLSVAMQHNSSWDYNPAVAYETIATPLTTSQKWTQEQLRACFAHTFKAFTFSADAHYKYAYLNYFDSYYLNDANEPTFYHSTVNEWGVNTKVETSNSDEVEGYAQMGFNRIAVHNDYYNGTSNHENHFSLKGNISTSWGDGQRIGISAALDLLSYHEPKDILNASTVLGNYNKYAPFLDYSNRGIVELTPYYDYSNGSFKARLGARLQKGIKEGGVKLSPHVQLAWNNPSHQVGLFATIDGGLSLNDYHTIFASDRYANFNMLHLTSSTPLNTRIGANFGPFAGLKASLWVAYSTVNDAMEYNAACNQAINQFFYHDIKGLGYGGEISYNYGSIAETGIKLMLTSNDCDKGYYTGPLRADTHIHYFLHLNPIKPLTINVDYHAQLNARFYGVNRIGSNEWAIKEWDNQDSHNLSLGARYAINNSIAVWAQGNNLLNKEYRTSPMIYAQKLNVMGGISFNF